MQLASNSWPHGISVDRVVSISKQMLHRGPSSLCALGETIVTVPEIVSACRFRLRLGGYWSPELDACQYCAVERLNLQSGNFEFESRTLPHLPSPTE